MSNNKTKQKIDSEQPKPSPANIHIPAAEIVFFISLGVLIIITLTIASFSIGKNKSDNQPRSAPVIDVSQTQHILGANTQNWYGTVTNINDNDVQISVDDHTAAALNTDTITAILKPATILTRWDLTNPSSPGQNSTEQEQILPEQIKTGNRVIVRSDEDMSDSFEVSASALTVLITP